MTRQVCHHLLHSLQTPPPVLNGLKQKDSSEEMLGNPYIELTVFWLLRKKTFPGSFSQKIEFASEGNFVLSVFEEKPSLAENGE